MKRSVFSIVCAVAGLSHAALPVQPSAAAYGLDIGKPSPRKSVTWEAYCTAPLPWTSVGFVKPRTTHEIADSPWSVGCETLERDFGDFDQFKDFFPELGVKRARLMSGWSRGEPKKGVYDFAWLDKIVYGLKERGVKPWMCLCYGNPLYRSETGLGAGLFNEPETVAAWARYVEAMVTHYKEAIDEWEVWNEPSHRADPIAFAALSEAAARAIRKVQPHAVINGFTVHGWFGGGALAFPKATWAELKRRGATGLFDYVTYHPYTPNPDRVYGVLPELQAAMAAADPKWKLRQGESGCPSQLEWGHAMNEIPWTEIAQAKWVLRRMFGDWTRGVPTSIFTMVDLRYREMLQSFGLLRCNLMKQVVYKRPAFYAVRNTAALVDASVRPGGPAAHTRTGARSTAVARFSKEGRPMLALWFDDARPGDGFERTPVDVTIPASAGFRDPVCVEPVTGRVMEFPKGACTYADGVLRFTGFPMWDAPTLVAERADVPLAGHARDRRL